MYQKYRDFPGGPVVKTAEGTGSVLGQGTKIPQATWSKNKKNKTLYQNYSKYNLLHSPFKRTYCQNRKVKQTLFTRNKSKTY